MKRSYRAFDRRGDCILSSNGMNYNNINQLFEVNPEVTRVEVFERRDYESIWEEKYITTYYKKDE